VNKLKQFLNFYIQSSLHVAISVISFSFLSGYRANFNISTTLLLFIFSSTVLGYNFIKFFGHSKLKSNYGAEMILKIKILSILSFFVVLTTIYKLSIELIIIVFLLSFVILFYDLPFYKFTGLRAIKGFKIYIISFVWSVTTVTLPILEANLQFESSQVKLFIERFIFVFILMLPFEIRDMSKDDNKLSTIPQKIGIRNTKFVGYFGLLVVFIFNLLFLTYSPADLIALILTILLTTIALFKSDTNNSIYFTSLWVEAIPIFWLFIIIILNSLPHSINTLLGKII
tara:strand:- start:178387 stop:179241 length:855 start_codon:yes stop_codon:yes gene_type:complete